MDKYCKKYTKDISRNVGIGDTILSLYLSACIYVSHKVKVFLLIYIWIFPSSMDRINMSKFCFVIYICHSPGGLEKLVIDDLCSSKHHCKHGKMDSKQTFIFTTFTKTF